MASWIALGGLWSRKKVLLIASWPLQEDSQDRFQRSWGPKGSPKGAQEGPKWSSGAAPRAKEQNLDFCRTSQLILLFLRSRGLSGAVKIEIKWLSSRSMGARGLPKPLESLLERSWRPPEPKKSTPERLLAGPRGISRQVSPKMGSKMGPQNSLRTPLFAVPIWGLKIDAKFHRC